ncbi:hypothetical protein GGF50DRAFT_121529, partial [Schizophyllum commune]
MLTSTSGKRKNADTGVPWGAAGPIEKFRLTGPDRGNPLPKGLYTPQCEYVPLSEDKAVATPQRADAEHSDASSNVSQPISGNRRLSTSLEVSPSANRNALQDLEHYVPYEKLLETYAGTRKSLDSLIATNGLLQDERREHIKRIEKLEAQLSSSNRVKEASKGPCSMSTGPIAGVGSLRTIPALNKEVEILRKEKERLNQQIKESARDHMNDLRKKLVGFMQCAHIPCTVSQQFHTGDMTEIQKIKAQYESVNDFDESKIGYTQKHTEEEIAAIEQAYSGDIHQAVQELEEHGPQTLRIIGERVLGHFGMTVAAHETAMALHAAADMIQKRNQAIADGSARFHQYESKIQQAFAGQVQELEARRLSLENATMGARQDRELLDKELEQVRARQDDVVNAARDLQQYYEEVQELAANNIALNSSFVVHHRLSDEVAELEARKVTLERRTTDAQRYSDELSKTVDDLEERKLRLDDAVKQAEQDIGRQTEQI